MNLTEFLTARIDEDEEVAQAAADRGERWATMTEETADGENAYYTIETAHGALPIAELAEFSETGRQTSEHVARHDPARVLAECEAKRRIVAGLVHGSDVYVPTQVIATEATLRLLALPYANHPDYDEAWRP